MERSVCEPGRRGFDSRLTGGIQPGVGITLGLAVWPQRQLQPLCITLEVRIEAHRKTSARNRRAEQQAIRVVIYTYGQRGRHGPIRGPRGRRRGSRHGDCKSERPGGCPTHRLLTAFAVRGLRRCRRYEATRSGRDLSHVRCQRSGTATSARLPLTSRCRMTMRLSIANGVVPPGQAQRLHHVDRLAEGEPPGRLTLPMT